jgi:hypothetical protein
LEYYAYFVPAPLYAPYVDDYPYLHKYGYTIGFHLSKEHEDRKQMEKN